jgi:hypothetical protein
MSYPHPGPPKHNPSTYSTASTDPYNRSVNQLPYDASAGYGGPPGGYAAPPGGNGQDAQYAPFQDTERSMQDRMDSGGRARDTYATESAVSQGTYLNRLALTTRPVLDIRLPAPGLYAVPVVHAYFHGG